MPKRKSPKVRSRTKTVKGRDYVCYEVNKGLIQGKRKFKSFGSQKAAEEYAAQWNKEREIFGRKAFDLTDEHARSAKRR